MNVKKTVLSLILCVAMLAPLLCACDRKKEATTPSSTAASSTPGGTVSTTLPSVPTTTPAPTTTTTPAPDPGADPASYLGLVINEVCAKNDTVLADAFGLYYDYVELYNGSADTIDLSGVGVSDREDDPFYFVFPEGAKVEAGERILLYATGRKGSVSTPEAYYASFALASAADLVCLSAPDGTLLDRMEIPALTADESYGRREDGSSVLVYMTATPYRANTGMTRLSSATARLSHESGFYADSFSLSVSLPEGYTLYYTTDSTTPTTASASYTRPLTVVDASPFPDVFSQIVVTPEEAGMWYPTAPVDKATVFRYMVVDPQGNRSEVATRSYFVDYDAKEGYEGISVLSLVTDPYNLYDPSEGIFVDGNWANRGIEWERPVSLTYFDATGDFVFTQDCGMRIRGASSRDVQQKSLSLYARDIYGANEFAHTFFEGTDYLKSFILRYDGSIKMHEGYLSALVADRAIATAKSIPCAVFLDGEYYGTYTILEKFTKQYVETYYGIDRDNVAIVKKGALEEGIASDLTDYNSFISFVTGKDMSLAVNYARACELMDMQSFIDYVCFQIYCGNEDWSLKQNFAAFRARETDAANPYADGKWRFMLYDLDFCIGIWNRYDHPYSYDTDTFTVNMPFAGKGPLYNPLFASLLKNSTFRREFATTFMDMANTCFDPDFAVPLLYETAAVYAVNIEQYYRRFGNDSATAEDYMACMDNFAYYFRQRCQYISAYMMQHLNLAGTTAEIAVSVGEGSVRFNTLELTEDFRGLYVTDYALSATAIAPEGYRFSHWEYSGLSLSGGSATSATVSVKLEANVPATLRAVYEES